MASLISSQAPLVLTVKLEQSILSNIEINTKRVLYSLPTPSHSNITNVVKNHYTIYPRRAKRKITFSELAIKVIVVKLFNKSMSVSNIALAVWLLVEILSKASVLDIWYR